MSHLQAWFVVGELGAGVVTQALLLGYLLGRRRNGNGR